MSRTTTAPVFRTPDRAAFVDGLRELADFVDARPTLPIPFAPSLLVFNHAPTDAERLDFITTSAAVLDADVITAPDHFKAVRMFGPIAYQLWASTLVGDADHAARSSYSKSVRP